MEKSGLSRSYVQGGLPNPLLGLTVGDVLDEAARRWPDREALVVPHQDIRWTWQDLQREARALAAGLVALGLRPGERIGILAPNLSEWVAVQFGTAYAGLILVNVNPAYRLPELEFALNKVGCRALITADRFKTSDYIAMLRDLVPEIDTAAPGELAAARLPDLRHVIRLGDRRTPGFINYRDVCGLGTDEQHSRLDDVAAGLDFDDPINIQFTSGTTGTPKAATLTHHNIVNNANLSARIMNFTGRDRLCIPVPMYHCFGMVLGSLLCATHGATMVFPSAGFDAVAVLDAIEAERCTALHGVPTMFIAALDAPGFADRDMTSLRTGIMAGAPCPVELMHRVMNDMHLPEITIGYGMTETGPLSTQTAVDDPVAMRVATVGRVLPHTEVKIVDAEGRILPPGAPGELCTRGYCVMRGYWADPERTAKEIDAAHWIRSGDIATLNDDGYVRIVGRIKDMVIRGGENIYPREIEEFLYTNPKIDEVEVFGVPDRKYGEELAAWIRLHEGQAATSEEIRNFCDGRLAHFKIPRYIKFVDEFPMTVTGKVQKFVMRQRMAEELGLGEKEPA
ncbi:MAG: AMP-binding protein [Alphaproteobacteria bacterium]|nr:AMP-binding protein [Alphaproteobacteria bacterium]